MPQPLHVLLVLIAGWLNRYQEDIIEYLKAENAVLRERLGMHRLALTDKERRRLALKGKALGRARLRDLGPIVSPDTILRWYRELVARKYDGTSRRRPGRPRTKQDIVELVLRMARENPGWGYTRIRDALRHVGHDIGRSTVKRILQDHGLEPAPHRGTSWATFIRAHWGSIAAADFFTTEVLTVFGLVRYHVLFVIDLATRQVEIAGITHQPYDSWMKQIARNLTMADDGFLASKTHVILDRDPLYTASFRGMLKDAGVKPVRLPAGSPNLNAFAERFVLSIKRECLDRVIPMGECHLRKLIREFVEHYHAERPHQGLDGQIIEPEATAGRTEGGVTSRSRLGGLLNYYYRAA